ncbi:MAG TPA: PEP/pyruvate-binding domain-containing protein, partial [Rhodospirillales bacterium]|nr:PEP/pyruvate-binding domain-containing protein [Rhodospirillales bacterium]
GKATSLGILTRLGVRVPPGFCILDDAFLHLLEANSLNDQIAAIIPELDFDDYENIDKNTGQIRSLIKESIIPGDLEKDIGDQYADLVDDVNRFVAVRSSVSVRNSDVSSFPGMMDTYHYILGIEDVLLKVRKCWASLWTTRAAFARHQQNVEQNSGVIAPVVQLMVKSEIAGVLFTANPINKHTGDIVIESNWGLGESVVSGKSMNDFYILDKDSLDIKQEQISPKTVMVTMDEAKGSDRIEIPVPEELASVPTLSENHLKALGEAGKRIEDHFGFNVDVEWAFQEDTLYILQARKIRGLEE